MSITARPSTTFTAILTGAPNALGSTLTAGIRELPSGTMVSAAANTGIVETDIGATSNYVATRTAPDDVTASYEVVWLVSGVENATEDLHVSGSALISGFGTSEDVGRRLGRDLTEAEAATAEAAIQAVAEMILEVAGTTEPDPVPAYYRALCIEKALAAISNPAGVAAESLGAHSVTYSRNSPGMFLTDLEERTIRRIANGSVSGSVRTHSLVHDVYVTEPES